MPSLPDSVARNQRAWNDWAEWFAIAGRREWARNEPVWGIWQTPEAEVRFLPAELEGKSVIEIGCGTAYVSSWIARRGGNVVGVDPTPRQLSTALELQEQHGLFFPLVQAAGESLPFADESFDVAVSEYGAALWADPYAWIPEAARVLRPGGELVFLTSSLWVVACSDDDENVPAGTTLNRSYFGSHRVEWQGALEVEYHLGHGDWFRLLRSSGFEVVDLSEIRPGPEAVTDYTWVTLDWARRWPTEEVWRARRVTSA